MRLVLDTNVVIAGLLWRGKPYELLGHVIDGKMQCFTSAPLIEELERVLGYDKLAKRSASLNTTIAALVADYLELVDLVIVADIAPAVGADPDDDVLLATALAADAEAIVSGDAHLLNLKHPTKASRSSVRQSACGALAQSHASRSRDLSRCL